MIYKSLPFQDSIKRSIINKAKKKMRLVHYNSLVNILASQGVVAFNGKVYRSMADLTIDFFRAVSNDKEAQEVLR